MTLNELMKKHNGVWENGFAVIQDRGGYYVRVAEGKETDYKITVDGLRLGLTNEPVEPPKVIETVVQSQPKKRGRKPAEVSIDLDDELEI